MTGDPTTGTARAPNMHDKVPIPGSELSRPSNSCLVGPVSPEKNIHLNILVRRRPDAPPVPDLAYWQKTPLSERRHVSPEEYREKYGAMQADLKVVSEFLNQHGMRIIEENLGTRTVSVLTTAAQIKSAFDVQLNHYQTVFPSPKSFKLRPSTNEHAEPEPHAHHGFEGSVHVPSHLEGILIAVIGLDDRCLPHGRLGVDPDGAKAIPVETAAALYNFPTTDSSDQTIGIISCQGGYLLSDITTYFSGKTQPTLVDIPLLANGVTWTNQGSQVNLVTSSNFGQFLPLVETTCDIQVAGTVARGCTINVYFTTNTEMGWQPQSGERQPTMVSCSWTLELMDDKPIRPGTSIAGLTNFAVLSSLFQDLAFQGINVFTDTGDWGADDIANTNPATGGITPDGLAHVGYPSSDPWVTAVGGTIIASTSTPPGFAETAWSDMVSGSGSFGGASGGGCSTLFGTTPPDYQVAAGITQRTDSNGRIVKGRFTPDISGMVTYNGFILNSLSWYFSGTSFSTPLNAGLFAVLRSSFGRSFGQLNSVIYPLGNLSDSPFNNVTRGNNDSGRTGGLPDAPFFDAADTPGQGGTFDLVTGWGSVDGTKMQNKLASLLYPRDAYFAVAKNSFSKAEVGTGASFPNAFWIVLQGYTALENVGIPRITCPLVGSGTGITISIGPRQLESKLQAETPQRILYPCTVEFTASSAALFPTLGNPPQAAAMAAEFLIPSIPPVSTGIECLGEIQLVTGADPYFRNITPDGNGVYYLSQDLRVFTVTPGITNRPISIPGAPLLNPASNTTVDRGAGYQYCQDLLNWLSNNFSDSGGADPFTLLPNQGNALTGDSSVSPTTFNASSSNFFTNYNFAVARVRMSGSTGTDAVKVFFRVFTSQSADTDYNASTTYHTVSGQPVLGTFESTIPFFATGNYGSNIDYTAASVNNKTIDNPTSAEKWVYFGCFLNIYDIGNTIGLTPVQSILAGTHHCLVAEISFRDTPIVTVAGQTASPSNSDKLAQRNLSVIHSDNPGGPETHLVPQTFDLRPSFTTTENPTKTVELPDELQIEWGNTEPGSTASIYWPQVNVPDVLALSKKLYATHQLSASKIEPDTIQCTVPAEGFTYIPIPFASSPNAENLAGLLTVQLPQGVVQGQEFLITVRRLATRNAPRLFSQPSGLETGFSTHTAASEVVRSPPTWRYITGSFAIRIPVSVPEEMVPIERDTQAIIAWRLNQLPPSNRWYKVLQRQLKYINARLTGLTGKTSPIVPSPIGVAGNPDIAGPGQGPGDRPHDCSCKCHRHTRSCHRCGCGKQGYGSCDCQCECHQHAHECQDCVCGK